MHNQVGPQGWFLKNIERFHRLGSLAEGIFKANVCYILLQIDGSNNLTQITKMILSRISLIRSTECYLGIVM